MTFVQKTEIKAFDTPFSELPPSLQACFSESEKVAYCTGPSLIRDALVATQEDCLKKLAKFIGNSQPMRVWVEQSPGINAAVWFGFSYNGLEHQPQFRLPCDNSQSLQAEKVIEQALPDRLRKILAALNGIRYDEDDEGGLIPKHEVEMIHLEPLARDAGISPASSDVVSFFRYPSGEVAYCDLCGEAFLLDSARKLTGTRRLDEFLDEYLQSLLEPDFLHRELGRDPMQH